MIAYNKMELGKAARERGFVRDTYEKVLRLTEVLRYMNEEAYMTEHLVLKGGTAINLSIVDLPRLSVDIDMDMIPNVTRDQMQGIRKEISDRLVAYMTGEGYSLSPASRFSYSLDAFLFNYQNSGGNPDHIKIELNYSLRSHLFEPEKRPLKELSLASSFSVRSLQPMEIYAAKANALMSRAAARDLFDFSYMVRNRLFDAQEDLFRKSIIFYATISADKVNKTFDTAAIDKLSFSKIRRDLFPVLGTKGAFDLEEHKRICKEYIRALMVPTEQENEYMLRFEKKDYKPELLFEDTAVLERIRKHPMALWKCSIDA